MNPKQLRKASFINLISGYLLILCFFFIILLNKRTSTELVIRTEPENVLVVEKNSTKTEKEYIYINPQFPSVASNNLRVDRLESVVTHRRLDKIPAEGPVVITTNGDTDYEILRNTKDNRTTHAGDLNRSSLRGRLDRTSTYNKVRKRDFSLNDLDIDLGILDRRMSELNTEKNLDNANLKPVRQKDGLDFSQLALARNDDGEELGDIIDLNKKHSNYGAGDSGELYAYNFPSCGVGAGIGSSAVGAGAAGGVGLSAGIGEGVLNGETVPTLGGVGASSSYGGSPGSGGVGGLIGGAGAGGAAGLTQGYVTNKLGGEKIKEGYGDFGGGYRDNYNHLPKNGGLHIMIHVDGSGSILNTRKKLENMRDTLLKDALLPYYNNDPALYDRRVSIIGNSGERTLRFFTEASQKDNVLAVAFQDEAQPAYHLPNFNRNPEDHYLKDLTILKNKLEKHKGVYRGVMFQVDRGKTFAKSFKEFVGNAFQGEGYLSNYNLKRYYWQFNQSNIKNKDGIVFIDEYHAKDEGEPQYYLDLLFNASRKIGLDLNIHRAGLSDGIYNFNK
jgi:hypothetical protein